MITNYVKFTPSEIKVLKGISEGLCNEEIAQILSCSIKTIQTHVYSIYTRLGIEGAEKRIKAVFIYMGVVINE